MSGLNKGDHDFLSSDLGGSSMNNPEFEIVGDVVDRLPNIFFNIESFNLLDIVEGKLTANSCFWLKALSSNNEYVLLIELAYTECLSRLLKTWE